MKGKKLVFAVILSLIVCLLLVPSAYADTEEQPTDNNSATQIVDTTDTDTDGDNGGSNNDSHNNESKDESTDSGDSESKNDSDSDSTSDDEGQSGVNDDSSDESKDNTVSDDTDNDTDSDSEDEEQENASEEETESDSAPTHTGDSNLPPQPDYTGFQVELTYNGKVVKMDGLKGGESHDLAEIIKELGIEGEVESAIGDADDLFNVTSDEKGMHFNTLMAFKTEQKLVVTVGGVEYVIIVTDDGAVVEVNKGESVQSKIDSAASGSTIKLMDDFTESILIPEGKTIILDLNGKMLTGSNTHTIQNKGNLTINGGEGTVCGPKGRTILNYGTAAINGGTYHNSQVGGYLIQNFGKITVNSGSFHGHFSGAMVANGWFYANSSDYKGIDATMEINGGDFDDLIKNDYHSKLVINDGANISGGIQNNGDLTINGGTYTRKTYVITAAGSTSITTINGGTFTTDQNTLLKNNPKSAESGSGVMTLNGGVFNVKINPWDGLSTTVNKGIYSDAGILGLVSKDTVVTEVDGKYAVNESAYDLAKDGKPLTIIKAPANTQIDNAPAGVTVVNNSGTTLIINGVTVKDGETVITVAPVTESDEVTNNAPVIKYWVVEGKDQTWTKSGNESIMFTLNSSAVIKVLIDGVEVEYEVDEDGKIVISAEVLEALEAGEHTVEFIFADGNCKTNIIIK